MLDLRPFQIIVMALLVVLYAGLRWWNIDAACLWFDEMFSVHAAEQSWSGLIDFIAADLVHPPLFYILLKIWIAIGGNELLWVRTLPFLFSIIAIIPFVLIGRELKLRFEVIATALFFLSVSGTLINYNQRVRMYTLLMALTLTAIWLFVRYIRTGKGLVPLIVVNIIAIYTQYFGAFVIGCEILVILLFYRERLRAAAWIGASAVLAFLPWASTVISAARSGADPQQNIGWVKRPGLIEIWTFLFDVIEPIYFQFSSEESRSIYFISIPLLLLAITLIALFFISRTSGDDTERALSALTIFAFAPMAVAFVVSWVMPYSIWGARHLIVCAGPLAMVAAIMLFRIDIKYVRSASLAVFIALSVIAAVIVFRSPKQTYLWCSWDQTGRELAASAVERERVYTFESIIAYHLWFASRDRPTLDVRDITDVEPTPEDETYFLPRGFDGVTKGVSRDIDGDRVRFIFRTHKTGEEIVVFDLLQSRGYKPCTENSTRHLRTNMFNIIFVKNAADCEN